MTKAHCHCGHDHLQCAARIPIFSSLTAEELQQVVSLIVPKQYKRDALILAEDRVNQHLIIVSSGKIKIYGYSPDGKEHIMYVLTDGDFYGARSLLQEKASAVTVQAMEDTNVCMIAREDFLQLLQRFPTIGLKIMEVLCNRLEKMEALVRKISPRDVDSRIQMMLLELAQKYGRPHAQGTLVELPMSREEMANYIGVARETLSRKLALLRDAGIIQPIGTRQLLIRDEEALDVSAAPALAER